MRPKPAAIADERVGEGDERIEDDGPALRDPPRRRQVEVPGVADDERVELEIARAEQADLCRSQAQSRSGTGAELVLSSVPDRLVTLGHLDPGAPQARDHLGVTGI